MKCKYKILDVCCGARMFWFDKNDQRAIFLDKRNEHTTLCDGRYFEVSPDIIADFTYLPFANQTFSLVVFDPPHLRQCGPKSWLGIKYGKLPNDFFKELQKGFQECWRVLKPEGTLIFKWNETQIPLREIKGAFPCKPLFGQKTTKNLKTHWVVFHKSL